MSGWALRWNKQSRRYPSAGYASSIFQGISLGAAALPNVLLLPTLAGLTWDRTRTPQWSTLVQTAISGRETRAALWSYPRYKYSVAFDILRSAAAFLELQMLMGFFMQRLGMGNTFLLDDPEDDSVSGQQIGIGDGQTLSWQLVRSLGGWTDPIRELNGSPAVYIAGVKQSAGWSVSATGLVTFISAPATGAAITADFRYYWRCRFLADEYEFNNAAYKWWECKKLEWITVK